MFSFLVSILGRMPGVSTSAWDRSLPLRERKKLRTRRALADAALRLFTEKGFGGTTLEEVAEEAEVSKSTFFRFFPGKGGGGDRGRDRALDALSARAGRTRAVRRHPRRAAPDAGRGRGRARSR